ncbi:MAG: aminoacyl-tRNA hydrolase [Candidatus Magasanikbacteria bacterium RIFCSPHIGHO2_01_FULL_50_8]|uniref:Peptidyl-tRNA hydrolase n=2 Tax=Candidatus Magasanikiibacteriota TaxID=1752731 RepID=A0A1F6LNM7_9BACT|nr:MAG: aminoacyl-tRNA hydrolase [Candidatus Magasanikbacteria bacterium RIFCSPHIGHO2_01_FULL_50_8]OGH67460.1 MAG: aminoacyl-tRNA hydrolase [Candidatus Magasanikbacteria bacterium RIFCSPHIGHO2_02_FULL_50_9b]
MWLVVGLGNPGSEYAATRHNAGWMAADLLARTLEVTSWRDDTKHGAHVASAHLDGAKILIAKPTTFMNESGAAVQSLAVFFKIAPDHIIVMHDDLDFPLGVVRTQFDRSAAGHNGVVNIIEKLGVQAFHRVRIGIANTDESAKQIDSADFVLQKFSADELVELAPALDTAVSAVRQLVARN